MFTADKNIIENIDFNILRDFIKKHQEVLPRYNKLRRYYLGEHEILKRSKRNNVPNNKIICNHAKEISDTATGYFIGNSISYTGENTEKLIEWFSISDIDNVDMRIAKNMSVYGKGYELINMSDNDKPTPKSYSIDPRNAFIIYDDTVEHKPLIGIYYYPLFNSTGGIINYNINIYTDYDIRMIKTGEDFENEIETGYFLNPFGKVQIIEYSNNEEQQGDFEQVISLIDAYNLLMSDRVNDKEQFVDAILILINAMFGDDPETESRTVKALKEEKMLELPGDADAKYLTRTFDENGIEILRKAIEQDIHKYSEIPCLSDENFVGNASGVAMEYKLLGLEQLTKIKERNFKSGIKKRIELYSAINEIKGGQKFAQIEPVFTRGLPKNLVEISSVISQLEGVVPLEILLPLLPFIKDTKKAIELLKEENAEKNENQRRIFESDYNFSES